MDQYTVCEIHVWKYKKQGLINVLQLHMKELPSFPNRTAVFTPPPQAFLPFHPYILCVTVLFNPDMKENQFECIVVAQSIMQTV
jgi:hypothetical protein